MPTPTDDSAAATGPRTPLQSPRDAQAWALVYRRRIRERPRDRLLRILAIAGALLVHLVFLFGMVLGSAYEPLELPDHDETPLLVKLLDRTEPPPPPRPPPLLGLPPKQLGPRHQGSVGSAKASPRTNVSQSSAAAALPPVPTNTPPAITVQLPPSSPRVETVAAPLPPISLPRPAPTPQLAPIPQAASPLVSVTAPSVAPPMLPKFQPEPVRPPRPEGNQPLTPPASLALPELPVPNSPSVTLPSVAIATPLPPAKAVPSLVPPTQVEVSAAPPTPELQPVPLPAQPSPAVNLAPSPVNVPAPNVPREQPRIQAPAIHVAEVQPETVPLAPAAPPTIEPPRPLAADVQAPPAPAPKIEFSVTRPRLSTPAAAPSPLAAAPSTPAVSNSAPATAAANEHNGHDVSTAPNATPRGSDTAPPGQPNGANTAQGRANGVPGALQLYGKDGSVNLGPSGSGQQTGQGERGAGPPNQGASGPSGTYVQLRPHGDTEIMAHGAPNLGYKRTRFEDDWTPPGESSVDTALRHAVEKTTMKHTFHLPRGVRVECVVMPLLPMALFGCGNADPPPAPVADKVYERMRLAPVKPLVPPSPSATAASAPVPIRLDNGPQCAAARVSGGPLPPGCGTANLPPLPRRPAAPSSSWVPASDQFH